MRLIIGYDGTSKDDSDIDDWTNVRRFMHCVQDGGTEDQRKKYVPGVGVGNKVGGAMGIGVLQKILEGYQWICENYQSPTDRICIAGFSRGACTARGLVRIINNLGIIRPECFAGNGLNDITDRWLRLCWSPEENIKAVDAWLWNAQNPGQSALKLLAGNTYSRRGCTRIEFCILWDTVSSLYSWNGWSLSFLEHQEVDRNVVNLFHALSLQEHRFHFQPDVLSKVPHYTHQTLKQCWFAGYHSDVGGGKRGAGNLSLAWIIAQIKMYTLGFHFNDSTITTILGDGIVRGGVFAMKDCSISNTYGGIRNPGTYHSGPPGTYEIIHWSLQALQERDLLPPDAVKGFTPQLDTHDYSGSIEFYQQPLDVYRGQWVRGDLVIPEACISAHELALLGTWIVLEEDQGTQKRHTRLRREEQQVLQAL